jgi:ElaB/YqjD/DUF883 family membrane-anchored ribosome-binding protein
VRLACSRAEDALPADIGTAKPPTLVAARPICLRFIQIPTVPARGEGRRRDGRRRHSVCIDYPGVAHHWYHQIAAFSSKIAFRKEMNMDFHAGAPLSTARRMALEGRETLGHVGSNVTSALHDAGDNALHAASRYYRQGRGVLTQSARDIEHYVEDQPIRSALVAIGVGCIVCAMLIRR